jgi:hypothetical protein
VCDDRRTVLASMSWIKGGSLALVIIGVVGLSMVGAA